MKKLRDVPTVPTTPSGTLMSVLASQPLTASAASTAPSSPEYVKPHGQLGDAQPRVLDFSKAEVKEAISEPCKIEGISMVLDDSQRGSGQRTGQTKEQTVSTKRGKKGKRGEETQPSTASFVAPKQHTAIPELQEDPRQSRTSGVADVQTVSKNRRGKTNKKGGKETQPSTASVADAGQHSSRPKLQEDPKESNTSGVVDAHEASQNCRAKTNKKGGEETPASTASVADAGQHSSRPRLQEDPKESKTSGVADVQTVSKNRRGKTNKKGGEETPPSTASVADAGQHSSCPKLQEDPKESNTSGVVDAHEASQNCRAKTNKKGGEETPASTASVADAGQHSSRPRLQEDPKESKTSGVADVQTVSKNRRGKTNKKGGEETPPSTASVADAGQHSSCPKLQEDPKESDTSGVVDAHEASQNCRAKTNKKAGEETQPSAASVANAGQHSSRPQLQEESNTSGAVDLQTVSTNRGSADGGKKDLGETSPSDPASDFAPQYPERTQRETVPIQAVPRAKALLHGIHFPSDGSRNVEPVELDKEAGL